MSETTETTNTAPADMRRQPVPRDYALSRWLVLRNDGYTVAWLGWARAKRPLAALDAMSARGYTPGGVEPFRARLTAPGELERRSEHVLQVCELGAAGLTAWKTELTPGGGAQSVDGPAAVTMREWNGAGQHSSWRCWRAVEGDGVDDLVAGTAALAMQAWLAHQPHRYRARLSREGTEDADVLLARVVDTSWWRVVD